MSELWVVAAGTGGHIFPGVEVAKEIQKIDPDISPLFFGTKNRLEAQIIPEQGLNFISIPAAPWKGKSPIGKIWGLCLILFSTIILCLRALKSPPKACLCVGGYVSLPIALVARLFKKPVFLIEPNIEAGAANKLISKWAQKAYCAPKSNVALQLQCRCEEFGIPTRKHSFPYEIRNKVRKILFLGGSQGAQSVNNAAIYCIPDLYKDDPEIQFTIQCGKSHEDEVILQAEKLSMSKNVQVKGFINQISEEMASSDLVVARAGAMTLSELSLIGIPSIVIPFPFAADDHQRKNALVLEEQKALRVVEESNPSFLKVLSTHLRELCFSEESFFMRKELSENIMKSACPNATGDIAQDIVDTLVKSSPKS